MEDWKIDKSGLDWIEMYKLAVKRLRWNIISYW